MSGSDESFFPLEQNLSTTLDSLSLSEDTRCTCHQSLPYQEERQSSPNAFVPTPDAEYVEQIRHQTAIREALDQQTQILYEQYAREQHPKDPEQQKDLVLQMQEQYFNHYLSDIQPNILSHRQQQLEQLSLTHEPKEEEASETKRGRSINALPLLPAVIWTRKDIREFKQRILKTDPQCCIKIGSLSTAVIRVPTHPDGNSVFWEFATDHYDLGFGLYFEWDTEPQSNVSICIAESSDEEDGYEDDDFHGRDDAPGSHGDSASRGDVERGQKSSGPQMPTDELIPIYRRDCHTEVYCGSHHYPGIGVYIFKFDNSFSLWRSKWLYHSIYYS